MTPAPPYTQQQIALLRTPEERLRARAELSSYVERLKQERAGAGNGAVNESLAPVEAKLATAMNNGATSLLGRGTTSAPQGNRFHPYPRPTTRNTSHGLAHRSLATGGIAQDLVPKQNAPTSLSLCPAFTATGYCARHACSLSHDTTKQALCRRWLYSNSCLHGINCHQSHQPSPNNAPTCLHFMRSHCKNTECRFAHVRINPTALNCERFGRLGYCEQGHSCLGLHAHECAAFSNTGSCIFGVHCRYGHVHRAARMRPGSRTPSKIRSPLPGTPTVDSPSQPGTPSEDSDSVEEQISPLLSRNASSQALHQFSQQDDFIPLGD